MLGFVRVKTKPRKNNKNKYRAKNIFWF